MATSGTVYVLGAGFSKPAGAPLGRELLPAIVELSKRAVIAGKKRDFLEEIVETLRKWFGELGVWNFEEILTIVYSKTLFQTLTGRSIEWGRKFRLDLMWAAIFAIEYLIEEKSRRQLYDRFARSLVPGDAVVSLNYDVILESALIRNRGGFSAGIPRPQVLDSLERFINYAGTPVIKIHGSSNLLRCANCRKWLVKGWKIAEDVLAPYDRRGRHLTCMECKGPLVPILVPPTMEKAGALANVDSLWASAAGALRAASRVVFIGCGLARADFDLEALLRMTIGKRPAVRIEVVSRTEKTSERYETIFPDRPVKFDTRGFEHWLEDKTVPDHCFSTREPVD